MTHKDNIKCSDFTDDNDLDEISELRGMRSDLGSIFSSIPPIIKDFSEMFSSSHIKITNFNPNMNFKSV